MVFGIVVASTRRTAFSPIRWPRMMRPSEMKSEVSPTMISRKQNLWSRAMFSSSSIAARFSSYM